MAKFNLFSAVSSVRKTFTDTFNRANQSGLGTASDGTRWSILTGAWEILSNKARGGSTSYPLATVTMATVNNNVELRGVSQGATVALWVTDSGEWWGVGIDQVAENCNCQTCSQCNAFNTSNCSGTSGGNCAQDQCNTWSTTCNQWSVSNCNAFTSTCNVGRNGQFTFANYNCNAFNTNSCNSWNAKNCGGGFNSSNCSSWNRFCTSWNAAKNCKTFAAECSGWNSSNCKSFNTNSCNSWNAKNCATQGNIIFNTWNVCQTWSTSCSGGFNTSVCINSFSVCQVSGCIAWNAVVCATYNASNCASESFFSCNCQTCYPQYIRVIRSVGSVVTELTSWVVSSVVQSFRVKTSGSQITIEPYSDVDLTTKIGNDLVYTPTGVQAKPTYGIMIKPSSYNQGYEIDSVKISRN